MQGLSADIHGSNTRESGDDHLLFGLLGEVVQESGFPGAGLAGQEETLVAAFDAGKKLPDERIVSVSGRKCPEPVVEVGQVELLEEV